MAKKCELCELIPRAGIFLLSCELPMLLRASQRPAFSPGFPLEFEASVNFMRLSSRKGAHAVLSSASWQEIRVGKWQKSAW
jgi:hypothetical protein